MNRIQEIFVKLDTHKTQSIVQKMTRIKYILLESVGKHIYRKYTILLIQYYIQQSEIFLSFTTGLTVRGS